MSNCIKDMKAYSLLTDDVLFQILNSDCNSDKMEDAKKIIKRIFKRDLYRSVYESDPLGPNDLTKKEGQKMTNDEIIDEIINRARKIDGSEYNSKNFSIQRVKLDFGMQDENPVEKLLVYAKGKEDEAYVLPREKASRILGPVNYSEMFLRVISHTKDQDVETLKKASKEFFKNLQTTSSSGSGENEDSQGAQSRAE